MNFYRIFQNLAVGLAICMGIAAIQITHAQTVTPEQVSQNAEELILTIAEEMPEFPGGQVAMRKYIAMEVRYPAVARKKNIQGKINIQFIVEKDGTISNIKALNKLGGGLEEEAIRIIQSMPTWKAGKQNGQLVRVQLTQPVGFKLE